MSRKKNVAVPVWWVVLQLADDWSTMPHVIERQLSERWYKRALLRYNLVAARRERDEREAKAKRKRRGIFGKRKG